MAKTKLIIPRTRGNVLLLVLAVCVICTINWHRIITLSLNARMMGVRAGGEIGARLAADAAVAQAIYQMNEN